MGRRAGGLTRRMRRGPYKLQPERTMSASSRMNLPSLYAWPRHDTRGEASGDARGASVRSEARSREAQDVQTRGTVH